MTPGPVDTLQNAQLTGTIWSGLTVTTRDGKPALLAIIDEAGNIIESGPAVARECWNVVLQVHRNYLQDKGHLIVHSTPPGFPGVIERLWPKPAGSDLDSSGKGKGKA